MFSRISLADSNANCLLNIWDQCKYSIYDDTTLNFMPFDNCHVSTIFLKSVTDFVVWLINNLD